jgi:hypothetical protein
MKTKVKVKGKRNPGNRGKMRLAAVQGKPTPVQQALEARKETQEMIAAPEHLKAVEKFTPIFGKLAERAVSLLLDTREACIEVVKYLRVAPTAEGKKKAMLVIKGCTTDGQVLTAASRWLAVILAEKKSANLGTVSREQEPNVWAEVPATASLIETQAELLGASTKANEALGIKKRGTKATGAGKAKKDTVTLDNVFDLIPQILESQAGRAKLRAILNTHGYDLTAGPGAIKTAKTA